MVPDRCMVHALRKPNWPDISPMLSKELLMANERSTGWHYKGWNSTAIDTHNILRLTYIEHVAGLTGRNARLSSVSVFPMLPTLGKEEILSLPEMNTYLLETVGLIDPAIWSIDSHPIVGMRSLVTNDNGETITTPTCALPYTLWIGQLYLDGQAENSPLSLCLFSHINTVQRTLLMRALVEGALPSHVRAVIHRIRSPHRKYPLLYYQEVSVYHAFATTHTKSITTVDGSESGYYDSFVVNHEIEVMLICLGCMGGPSLANYYQDICKQSDSLGFIQRITQWSCDRMWTVANESFILVDEELTRHYKSNGELSKRCRNKCHRS